MNAESAALLARLAHTETGPLAEGDYVAAEYFAREDVAARQARISSLVGSQIVPRLARLHNLVTQATAHPTAEEIAHLAQLLLGPDIAKAAAYVTLLREQGLSMDTLFVELLEPAARELGAMWDRDECDFVDVTLGLARLQKLLAVFNCTHRLPAAGRLRRVLLLSVGDDPHLFGVSMVEKFLRAGGWQVRSLTGLSHARVAEAVRREWYAVVGVTIGADRHLKELPQLIGAVRGHACNPAIGILVGGSALSGDPALARKLGADATALDAPTAVLAAQLLYDAGARDGWNGSAPAE